MRVETEVRPQIGAQPRSRQLDRAIAALARRQHGVVSRAQLLEFGLGRRAIGNRLEGGRLHVLHRGVYAVGHVAVPREARWMAAVLAAGPGAVLSHRSAGALWGVRRTAASSIDVTVARKTPSRPGLRVHQTILPRDEVTVVEGIPVTSTPRTLFDLAAVLTPEALERAVNEVEVLRLTDPLSLADLLTRHPRRRGAAALKRLLDDRRIGAAITRSELEERFLALLDRARLPRPRVNAWLELAGRRFEVDCLWREAGLVVELDGYASHGTRAAFDRDRSRDRALQAAGWRVARVTWRHLHDDPGGVAAELRSLLDPQARATRAEKVAA